MKKIKIVWIIGGYLAYVAIRAAMMAKDPAESRTFGQSFMLFLTNPVYSDT